MSRDVLAKLDEGEALDDDDIKYMVDRGRGQELVDRGIEVPVSTYVDAGNFGTPTGNIFETGAAFEMANQPSAMGPGVFLNEEALSSLTNDTLDEIAQAVGVEVPAKKAAKVAALAGAGAAPAEEDEDEEDEES